jgi:hypothetical protein
MTERLLFLYASSGEAMEQGITRCKTLARTNEFTLATTLTQATQKSAAARPGRAPQDHHGAQAMLYTTARDQKKKKHTGRRMNRENKCITITRNKSKSMEN